MPDKPSIAVLAFTNMSGDEEGILLTDRRYIGGAVEITMLFVIARQSSTYRGAIRNRPASAFAMFWK